MSKPLVIGALVVLVVVVGLGIAFPQEMHDYESVAVWLEGIALVAIFIWERLDQERQERVYPYFELDASNGVLFVSVSNLGISNFLVSGIHVRSQDIAKFHYSVQEVIESGKTGQFVVHRDVCVDRVLSIDLEITLEYVGLDGQGTTEPKCFNVVMGLNDVPHKVKKGVDGIWSIECPKCHEGFSGMRIMSNRGLTTFEEAFRRKAQIQKDFQNTCPDHDSELLMK